MSQMPSVPAPVPSIDDQIHAAMAADDTAIAIFAGPADAADPSDAGRRGPPERTLHKTFGPWRVLRLAFEAPTVIGTAVAAADDGARVLLDLSAAPRLDGLSDALMRHGEALQAGTGGGGAPRLFIRCRTAADQGSRHQAAILAAQTGLLTVALPADALDARTLTAAALGHHGPVLLLEPETGPAGFPDAPGDAGLGRGRVVRRGTDVTVVAPGPLAHAAAEAADRLARSDGLHASVIDPRTVAPLDRGLILDDVARTGRLAVLDLGPVRCPFAAEIAACVAERGIGHLIAPVRRITVAPDRANTRTTAEAVAEGIRGTVSGPVLR